MYDPFYDRTDWRRCDDQRLTAAARESNHELCIALGERLEDLTDIDDQLQDVIAERDELDKRVALLLTELNELHEALKGTGAGLD
jgi:hypothetical protein